MGMLRKRHRHKEPLEFSLNITSLMDVLTVLLFFLLKSFSVTAAAVTPPEGLRLPNSEIKNKIEEAVTVALSSEDLRANNQVLLKLDHGRFIASDIGPDHRTLVPLKAYLESEFKKRNKLFDKAGVDKNALPPGKLLIQADKGLSFSTVKYLLHTASTSGYSDYQFVINNPEE